MYNMKKNISIYALLSLLASGLGLGGSLSSNSVSAVMSLSIFIRPQQQSTFLHLERYANLANANNKPTQLVNNKDKNTSDNSAIIL